jgi:hypothetical protein
MSEQNGICCPQFNPELWDRKVFDWQDKRFVKNKVFTLFYMPINFGSVMTKLVKKVEEAGAKMPEGMVLGDHRSKWALDLYVGVDKEVPGVENVVLSGKFLTKVYEGPYSQTGTWMKDFDIYVKSQNLAVKKLYMWYVYCPKCAKKYGKNYVVLVGQV